MAAPLAFLRSESSPLDCCFYKLREKRISKAFAVPSRISALIGVYLKLDSRLAHHTAVFNLIRAVMLKLNEVIAR